MRCEFCDRPKTCLFYTYECDDCLALQRLLGDLSKLHHGWAIVDVRVTQLNPAVIEGHEFALVYETRDNAKRHIAIDTDKAVVRVVSRNSFDFRGAYLVVGRWELSSNPENLGKVKTVQSIFGDYDVEQTTLFCWPHEVKT